MAEVFLKKKNEEKSLDKNKMVKTMNTKIERNELAGKIAKMKNRKQPGGKNLKEN